MKPDPLTILETPRLNDATMLLALTGWMDGGFVSTGTVKQLMEGRNLVEVARIEPAGFYIDNFPGSMELAALFRPHVRYVNGLIRAFEMPANEIYADPDSNIAFFIGKEPNLNWPAFADCVFEVANKLGVKRIIFMGSFGGGVPHTREPRLFASVSDRTLLPLLKAHVLRPSDYEGPASFATYLLSHASGHVMEMLSIAVEIPGYLQGVNPLSIEAVTKRLAKMLGLTVDFTRMRAASNEWETQVSEAVAKDEEMAETVRKLEEQYDTELISTPEPE